MFVDQSVLGSWARGFFNIPSSQLRLWPVAQKEGPRLFRPAALALAGSFIVAMDLYSLPEAAVGAGAVSRGPQPVKPKKRPARSSRAEGVARGWKGGLRT